MRARRRFLGTCAGLTFALTGVAPASDGNYRPPTSREDFQIQFRHAFANHDYATTAALFYWRGVPARSRSVIVSMIERDLRSRLIRTAWLPPPPVAETGRGFSATRSNLTVIARFAAQFVNLRGRRYVSVHNIGVHEGVFYIALLERVPSAA
ncbi:MAG: hypothetical protein AAF458_01995 [Pseudomonadota bacterium]